ncbi:hypothetical protein, partial [Muribaculum caecicola]|uniref:hypothetical protein n=1 Tax=Muribaculum caecicola TaxID=3038144 RepID=UPI00240F8FDB
MAANITAQAVNNASSAQELFFNYNLVMSGHNRTTAALYRFVKSEHPNLYNLFVGATQFCREPYTQTGSSLRYCKNFSNFVLGN